MMDKTFVWQSLVTGDEIDVRRVIEEDLARSAQASLVARMAYLPWVHRRSRLENVDLMCRCGVNGVGTIYGPYVMCVPCANERR